MTSETPCAYLCWATDDAVVPPTNSTRYRSALRKAGVPVTYKAFPSGGHGFGFSTTYTYHAQMIASLKAWLAKLDGILTSVQPLSEVKTPTSQTIGEYNIIGQRTSSAYRGIRLSRGHKRVVR